MRKSAETDHPILEPIAERWSPYAFADRPVEPNKLHSIFEAARWAPSAFNEQPWRFFVGSRDGDPAAYEALLNIISPFNRPWAQTAPVLGLSVAKRTYTHNGAENAWAAYDTGQAMGLLLVQATALGLHVHQMAGYDQVTAREVLRLSDDFSPVAAFAIGYVGDPDERLSEERHRDKHRNAGRPRRPLTGTLLSAAGFGARSPLVPDSPAID